MSATITPAQHAELRARVHRPLTAAVWDPDLHPRGHDGRFIEIGALLKLLSGDNKNKRGTVTEIVPDPNDRGNPTLRVQLEDGTTVDAKPADVEQAAEKARLDLSEPAPEKRGLFGRRQQRREQEARKTREALGAEPGKSGLTERMEDLFNGDARDEWAAMYRAEWEANPDNEGKEAPNFYAQGMEEVQRRREEGRLPGPEGGTVNDREQAHRRETGKELPEPNRPTPAEAMEQWREQNRRYSPPLASETPREVDAGNVYVGDEILLPGDIAATVTGMDMVPGTNDVMILETTMGPRRMRLSDRIQVIPKARRASGELDDGDLLALWLHELGRHGTVTASVLLVELETEARTRGFDLPTAATRLLTAR